MYMTEIFQPIQAFTREKLQPQFTDTLQQVLKVYLDTIQVLREMYIPFTTSADRENLSAAIEWLSNSPLVFDSLLELGVDCPVKEVPDYVLANIATLELLRRLSGELPKDRALAQKPVAYPPELELWRHDLLKCTRDYYLNIMRFTGSERSYDLDTPSSSRTLAIIQQAKASGWTEGRAEASDLLASYLFHIYWTKLCQRI